MTAGGREFQVAGVEQPKDRFAMTWHDIRAL